MMTAYHDVRDALIRLTDGYGMAPKRLLTDSAAFAIAPKIEAALRATAESMENYYLSCGVPRDRKRSKLAMDKCVTAGIAAMQ